MSLRTLPVLFFNLGGEMLYILDQRLKAQNISLSKSQQVVQDIVGQMFDSTCMKELFSPQRVLAMKSLRMVFNKLAHASIMKLNMSAMDKLYDLMIMATKHQLLMCRRGEDVILVTLNHLDNIRKMVGESDYHLSLVDSAIRDLTEFFIHLSGSEFILLRFTLLYIFQDSHKRVSVFLKDGVQKSNGRFIIPVGGPVPNGIDIPGTIRYYDEKGDIKDETKFDMPFKYELPEPPGSWALHGDRVIALGTNMYTTGKTMPAATSTSSQEVKEDEDEQDSRNDDTEVTAELKLLEKLLLGIRIHTSNSSDTFKLNLFAGDGDDDGRATDKFNVLEINPSKKGTDVLTKIAMDFDTRKFSDEGSNIEDDLLGLMDSTS